MYVLMEYNVDRFLFINDHGACQVKGGGAEQMNRKLIHDFRIQSIVYGSDAHNSFISDLWVVFVGCMREYYMKLW